MQAPKRFVCVIRSCADGRCYYTGVTSDPVARLASHNGGECLYTARYTPWKLDVTIEFSDETRAVAFERYLKSASGVAFAAKHSLSEIAEAHRYAQSGHKVGNVAVVVAG